MALKKIARIGDTVRNHFDVLGNEVFGSITTASGNVKNGGIGIAATDFLIVMPSHPHQIDGGGPTDYRSHTWRVVGSGKNKVNGKNIAREDDGGNDDDHDGFQTLPSSAEIVASTGNLFSE